MLLADIATVISMAADGQLMVSRSRRLSIGLSRDARAVAEVLVGIACSQALHVHAVDLGLVADRQVSAVVAVVSVGRSKRGRYCVLVAVRKSEREEAIGRSLRTLARRMRYHHTGSRLTHVPVAVKVEVALVVRTVAVGVALETSRLMGHHQGDWVSSVAVRAVILQNHSLCWAVAVCPAEEASVVDEAVDGQNS